MPFVCDIGNFGSSLDIFAFDVIFDGELVSAVAVGATKGTTFVGVDGDGPSFGLLRKIICLARCADEIDSASTDSANFRDLKSNFD